MMRGLVLKTTGAFARSLPLDRMLSIVKFGFLKRLLCANQIDLIVDVGANVGQFGRSMREIGYTGRIISFEPIKAQYERLTFIARGDKKWRIYNCALGEQATVTEMNVMQNSLFSSLKEPTQAQTTRFANENTALRQETVQVRRLDEVANESGIESQFRRAFLKSDTQGFDLHVLKGAGDYLSQIRMLQVEVSVARIYDSAPTMNEMLGFLESRGFLPVGLFPVNRLPDSSAVEFDYIGVNGKQITDSHSTAAMKR